MLARDKSTNYAETLEEGTYADALGGAFETGLAHLDCRRGNAGLHRLTMHVVVSGAAGHLAQSLLPVLCAEDAIERVTGIDRREVGLCHPKLRTLQADVSSATAVTALRGADAVVHLAFVTLRGWMSPAAMVEANVSRTRAFLAAAGEVGVPHIVFLSSAAVYGAGEHLKEEASLRPVPGFLYAQHKVECECWLESQLPQAVRLRPHVILGPHALPLLKTLADALVYPRLPEPAPQLQCVHELDVSKAVLRALGAKSGGAYNLAAPQSFSLRELVKWRHPRGIAVPQGVLRATLWFAWRINGWGGEPGWHEGLAKTLTLDCERAERELGWRPGFIDWRSVVAATFAPY